MAVSLSALIGFAAAWVPSTLIIIILQIPIALISVLISILFAVVWAHGLGWVSPLECFFRGVGAAIDWYSRAAHFLSHDAPFIKRLEQARLDAQAEVEKIEERWKREAGEWLFSSRLAELQSDKREYERLEEMRYAELKRLEPISHQARVEDIRAIGDRRRQLETRLAGGAIYLYGARQEIEENRRKLFPSVIEAHRSLAQAEWDLKAASNSGWLKEAVIVLIIAFAAGSVTKYGWRTEVGE